MDAETTRQLTITLLLLGACVFFFVINKPRMDIVALLAILALSLFGILSPKEVFSGFSDQSIILIGLMFVVGEGLVRTGVSGDIGAWILKKAGGNETKLIVFMMLAVAIIGAFMSSTGIVAIFIPIVMGISRKLGISPAKLMLPLCFAGLISGMMSLVSTPPNIVINSVLQNEGFAGFKFFSITPIGLIVLAAGIGYMLYIRRFLGKKDTSGAEDDATVKTTLKELARKYNVSWRDSVLTVEPGSPFVGKEIRELPLRAEYSANIVCIERRKGLNRKILDPEGTTKLQAHDALLIDFFNINGKNSSTEEALRQAEQIADRFHLKAYTLQDERYFRNAEREFGLVEVSVLPDSPLEGRSAADVNFRTRYGMSIAGIFRKQKAITQNIVREQLRVGDMLLLIGSWKAEERLATHRKSFIVLNTPVEQKNATAAPGRAPYAIIALIVMVALMITEAVPNTIAALIGCILLLFTKCIDMDSAYRSINWSTLILIIGMVPFAVALKNLDAVSAAANCLMGIFGSSNPYVILGVLMAFTMMVGLFMSNTVTALLLAPLAVQVAKTMEMEPTPFAMGLAIAASTAFMTPISSPVNTLVLGPGGYRFMDFVKYGVPFSVLVLIIGIIFIPIFFPFAPLAN